MRHSWTRGRSLAVVLLLCAGLTSGCAYLRVPRIDPSGQRFFIEPPIVLPSGDPCDALVCPQPTTPQPMTPQPMTQPISLAQSRADRLCVTLTPRTIVAPVGSEVALVAGVHGSDGYLRTNQRVEWSISPGGVGHFVAVAKNGTVDLLLGDFNRPRKVDNTFAIGSTLRTPVTLDRGTPTTEDDICVLNGQAWVTLTSPVEGTSHVVAYAPKVPAWDDRVREATVHWIDAQWRFPEPSIHLAGTQQVLTTSVTRQTDQSPCEGWRVRYEIVDGPPAAFAPDGQSVVEVDTDSTGKASVEIYQTEPGPGTNKVCIQIIRPRAAGGAQGERLVVGRGTTLKTWSSPDLAVQQIAPAIAGVGTTVRYRIEVSNPGDLPAEDVIVTDQIPDAIAYVSSNPPGVLTGSRLEWQMGQLGAGETRVIELDCRADELGSVTNCVDAVAAGGLEASQCATTTVTNVDIELSLTGPAEATVGTDVTFSIVVTNLGQAATDALLIKDRFDVGFKHADAPSPIEKNLGILAPGASQQVRVTLRPTQAGQLCHSVEILGTGGVYATKELCITAVEAAVGGTATSEPDATVATPQPAGQPSISVTKVGPTRANVDEKVLFTITVTNTGTQRLTGIKIVDQYAPGLVPLNAAIEHTYDDKKNQFTWTLDSLEPGETAAELRVECQCSSAANQACNRVTVTTQEGAQDEAEVCLEVVGPAVGGPAVGGVPGNLTLTVADTRDPIAADKPLTYDVEVKNQGLTADRQIAVTVTFPIGMIIVPLGTSGPRLGVASQGAKPTIAGQTVRFGPIDEITAGQTLTYRIRVLAAQPGEMTVRAQLTSENLPQGIQAEERTTVF